MKLPDQCPKCGGEMEPGFLLEAGHGNARSVTQWVAGTPEKSFWLGLKVSDRAQFNVATHRCQGCGFTRSRRARNED